MTSRFVRFVAPRFLFSFEVLRLLRFVLGSSCEVLVCLLHFLDVQSIRIVAFFYLLTCIIGAGVRVCFACCWRRLSCARYIGLCGAALSMTSRCCSCPRSFHACVLCSTSSFAWLFVQSSLFACFLYLLDVQSVRIGFLPFSHLAL